MKNNIAFDIDGVLVDLMSQFCLKLREQCRAKIANRESYRIITDPFLSDSQIWDLFWECYEDYESTPIYPCTIELINAIYAITGQPILMITCRPALSASFTYGLIDRFCKIPYVVAFAANHQDKIKYMNDVDYLVEDRRATAKWLTRPKFGKKVLLIDKPYNQMPDRHNVIRIESLSDIINQIGLENIIRLENKAA